MLLGCTLAQYTTPFEVAPKPKSNTVAVKNPFIPLEFGIQNPLIGYAELSPTNAKGSAPVLSFNGNNKLELSYDVLTNKVPVLAVRFNHHQPDWQSSGLPRPLFLEGNSYEIVEKEVPKSALGPIYRSFSFTFPNKPLRFKFSGNYSLELFDPATNYVWLRLPFFVSEEKNSTNIYVEQIYATGRNTRIIHQPFLAYKTPDFVQFPISQIQAVFYKNQFWGESIIPDRVDQNAKGELGFHPSRSLSFIADDQTRTLNLRDPVPDNFRIIEVDRPNNNLKVTLQRDTPGLDVNNSRSNIRRNLADSDRDAEYISTVFSLEIDIRWFKEEIYLVGDFTNWQVDKRYRMRTDNNADFPFLTTTALIKEGIHSYAYVHLRSNGELDKRVFMNPFSSYTNRYDAFIYYLDPEVQIYRLLQNTHTTVSE